jgi:hypothetical protein
MARVSFWVGAFNALLCVNLAWTALVGIAVVYDHQTCAPVGDFKCVPEFFGPLYWVAGELLIALPLLVSAVAVSVSPDRRGDEINWIGRSALFLTMGAVFIAALMIWIWSGLFPALLIMILTGAVMADPERRRRENTWIRLGALALVVGLVLASVATVFWLAS